MSSNLSDPLLRTEEDSDGWTANGKEDLENGVHFGKSDDRILKNGPEIYKGESPSELESDRQGTSSFWAASSNTIGLLLGMGMLSVPYALQQGGLFTLSLLVFFGAIATYTAFLLGKCLGADPALQSFQDIAGSAFGLKGRIVLTICLYLEICACLVGFVICVGDNLAQLFPNAGLSLSWIHLEASQLLVIISMLVVLPTICVRDLSFVSFFSFSGVVASVVVVGAVAWTGVFGGVGFTRSVPLLNFAQVPLVTGLYAFCYSGHVIMPNIYISMKEPRQFLKVLIVSFGTVTVLYGGVAFMGACMFGDDLRTQITLNIPTHMTVGTVALWTTVITPVCKFSIGISPVAKELESKLPFPENSFPHFACGSLIRITMLLLIVATALAFPFFGDVLSFIGSALSIVMSIIFPTCLYLKLFWPSVTSSGVLFHAILILVGLVFGVFGTEAALKDLIESMRS